MQGMATGTGVQWAESIPTGQHGADVAGQVLAMQAAATPRTGPSPGELVWGRLQIRSHSAGDQYERVLNTFYEKHSLVTVAVVCHYCGVIDPRELSPLALNTFFSEASDVLSTTLGVETLPLKSSAMRLLLQHLLASNDTRLGFYNFIFDNRVVIQGVTQIDFEDMCRVLIVFFPKHGLLQHFCGSFHSQHITTINKYTWPMIYTFLAQFPTAESICSGYDFKQSIYPAPIDNYANQVRDQVFSGDVPQAQSISATRSSRQNLNSSKGKLSMSAVGRSTDRLAGSSSNPLSKSQAGPARTAPISISKFSRGSSATNLLDSQASSAPKVVPVATAAPAAPAIPALPSPTRTGQPPLPTADHMSPQQYTHYTEATRSFLKNLDDILSQKVIYSSTDESMTNDSSALSLPSIELVSNPVANASTSLEEQRNSLERDTLQKSPSSVKKVQFIDPRDQSARPPMNVTPKSALKNSGSLTPRQSAAPPPAPPPVPPQVHPPPVQQSIQREPQVSLPDPLDIARQVDRIAAMEPPSASLTSQPSEYPPMQLGMDADLAAMTNMVNLAVSMSSAPEAPVTSGPITISDFYTGAVQQRYAPKPPPKREERSAPVSVAATPAKPQAETPRAPSKLQQKHSEIAARLAAFKSTSGARRSSRDSASSRDSSLSHPSMDGQGSKTESSPEPIPEPEPIRVAQTQVRQQPPQQPVQQPVQPQPQQSQPQSQPHVQQGYSHLQPQLQPKPQPPPQPQHHAPPPVQPIPSSVSSKFQDPVRQASISDSTSSHQGVPTSMPLLEPSFEPERKSSTEFSHPNVPLLQEKYDLENISLIHGEPSHPATTVRRVQETFDSPPMLVANNVPVQPIAVQPHAPPSRMSFDDIPLQPPLITGIPERPVSQTPRKAPPAFNVRARGTPARVPSIERQDLSVSQSSSPRKPRVPTSSPPPQPISSTMREEPKRPSIDVTRVPSRVPEPMRATQDFKRPVEKPKPTPKPEPVSVASPLDEQSFQSFIDVPIAYAVPMPHKPVSRTQPHPIKPVPAPEPEQEPQVRRESDGSMASRSPTLSIRPSNVSGIQRPNGFMSARDRPMPAILLPSNRRSSDTTPEVAVPRPAQKLNPPAQPAPPPQSHKVRFSLGSMPEELSSIDSQYSAMDSGIATNATEVVENVASPPITGPVSMYEKYMSPGATLTQRHVIMPVEPFPDPIPLKDPSPPLNRAPPPQTAEQQEELHARFMRPSGQASQPYQGVRPRPSEVTAPQVSESVPVPVTLPVSQPSPEWKVYQPPQEPPEPVAIPVVSSQSYMTEPVIALPSENEEPPENVPAPTVTRPNVARPLARTSSQPRIGSQAQRPQPVPVQQSAALPVQDQVSLADLAVEPQHGAGASMVTPQPMRVKVQPDRFGYMQSPTSVVTPAVEVQAGWPHGSVAHSLQGSELSASVMITPSVQGHTIALNQSQLQPSALAGSQTFMTRRAPPAQPVKEPLVKTEEIPLLNDPSPIEPSYSTQESQDMAGSQVQVKARRPHKLAISTTAAKYVGSSQVGSFSGLSEDSASLLTDDSLNRQTGPYPVVAPAAVPIPISVPVQPTTVAPPMVPVPQQFIPPQAIPVSMPMQTPQTGMQQVVYIPGATPGNGRTAPPVLVNMMMPPTSADLAQRPKAPEPVVMQPQQPRQPPMTAEEQRRQQIAEHNRRMREQNQQHLTDIQFQQQDQRIYMQQLQQAQQLQQVYQTQQVGPHTKSASPTQLRRTRHEFSPPTTVAPVVIESHPPAMGPPVPVTPVRQPPTPGRSVSNGSATKPSRGRRNE